MRRLLIGLVLAALAISGCTRKSDPSPSTSTRMVLLATDPTTPQEFDRAGSLIAKRIEAVGMGKAKVTRDGDKRLIVDVPGKPDEASLIDVAGRGLLTFRKVLRAADGTGPDVATQRSGRPTLAQVQAKLGPAYQAAQGLTAVADPSDERLRAFASLTTDEIAVLPAEIQFRVPGISCFLLKARPHGSTKDGATRAVACEQAAKYVLDVVKVTGADVQMATAVNDLTGWAVNIAFAAEGQRKWTDLTREAYHNDGSACDQSALGNQGRCRIAILVDDTVITAPEILGVISDVAMLSGGFTKARAEILATQIRYGALPVAFDVVSLELVEP
jgi:preprotein translocase subunit SecD